MARRRSPFFCSWSSKARSYRFLASWQDKTATRQFAKWLYAHCDKLPFGIGRTFLGQTKDAPSILFATVLSYMWKVHILTWRHALPRLDFCFLETGVQGLMFHLVHEFAHGHVLQLLVVKATTTERLPMLCGVVVHVETPSPCKLSRGNPMYVLCLISMVVAGTVLSSSRGTILTSLGQKNVSISLYLQWHRKPLHDCALS